MWGKPERRAWLILWAAFTFSCILATGVPLSIWWYISNDTRVQATALEVISGTVLIEEPGQGEAKGITNAKDGLLEGARIKTDATSWATLTFRKGNGVTLGTVTIYSETELVVLRMRSPRFEISSLPDSIVLKVEGGRVRLGVAPPIQSPLRFEVHTPHASALLQEGSHSVEVTNDQSQIVVRDGQVQVMAAGETVTLKWGERTTVEMGQPPSDPMPAALNLLTNGNFKEGLLGWQAYNEQGVDGGLVDGQAKTVESANRQTVHFSRTGEDGNHCETGIIQRIDKDVRDFNSLKLHIDVRLLYQSLSGGGYLSSEFPIIVRVDYRDPYGFDRFWTHGFYYQNEDNYPIQNGEQVPRYRWYPYESENLMDTLGDVGPVYINSVRIYASGWNYQSEISEVGLIVE